MTAGIVMYCGAVLSAGMGVLSCLPPTPPPVEMTGYVCPNAPDAIALAVDLKGDVIPPEPCGADTIMVGDGPEAWSPRTVVRFKHGGQWYLLHYFVPKDDGFSIVLLEPLLES